MLEPAHVVGSRLRVEVPGLYGDPTRKHRIERSLARAPFVLLVRANPHTGRVLVELAESSDELRREILEALRAEGDPEAPEPPSLQRMLASAAIRARGLVHRVRRGLRHKAPETEEEAESLKVPPWHAQPSVAVTEALAVDPGRGLSSDEIEARLREHGHNVLAGIEPRSTIQIIASQVLNVPFALLGGAAMISLMLGDLLEATAIVAVAGSNVAVGAFTEMRAEELLDAWGQMRVEWARVLRDGHKLTVRAAEIVPGDVLVLRAGEPVAADARVVEAEDLSADESTLTGESEPVEKRDLVVSEHALLADRHSMVYAGTVIASGRGLAVVTATGQRTELGAIQRALSKAQDRAAPLERQLDALGKQIGAFCLVSSGAIIAIGLLRGTAFSTLLRSAVALGVAAIPEGLPAVGTSALALASRRLFRSGIIIRKLAAAETLGAVSAVCADKTGTLTLNRMRVEALYLRQEGLIKVDWPENPHEAPMLRASNGRLVAPEHVRDLARIAALNADVEVSEDGTIRRGSGTERGLVEFALGVGYPVVLRRRRARRVREERRSAERAFMVTVHDHPELGRIELVKGAPEQVVPRCNDLDARAQREVLRQNEAMASRGLRVLACAFRHDGRPEAENEPLVFAGLMGLRDPPREGVSEAIRLLERAGVHTYMLTGDQQRTALAIARELEIAADSVYSRVTPEAKVFVVSELQQKGRIVAMTGDGVNDGPALKAADVGVAMGERGTDIARAVADVVLAHDDLPSLATAVAEGRRLYDNVRRAIDYLVATNLSEVMVMLLGSTLRTPPLAPLQLLWLNMLTDVAPALALALEPADAQIMQRPPRDPAAPLFNAADYRRLSSNAMFMASVSLASYGFGRLRGGPGQPSAFTALIVAQLCHTSACRAQHAARGQNPYLDRALAVSFALQAAAYASRPLRHALGLRRFDAIDLAIAALLGVLPTAARGFEALLGAENAVVVERRPMPAILSTASAEVPSSAVPQRIEERAR